MITKPMIQKRLYYMQKSHMHKLQFTSFKKFQLSHEKMKQFL